jgi:predicted restriction endonuclease
MPTHLKKSFAGYLEMLPLTPYVRNNYRQYVRWIEKYGSGEVNLDTMRTEENISHFVEGIAREYDTDHLTGRRFNARKSDAKTIIRHYLKFLQDDKLVSMQEHLEQQGEFNASNLQQGKEKVLRNIALRRGQPKFRNNLLTAYEGKCAVTGTAIEDVLEAAHIIPYNGISTNHVCNGLLLRSDIHDLFDLGLLSINPETLEVYCCEQIKKDSMYRELNGKKIRVPSQSHLQPNYEALRRHFENRAV